MRESAVPPAGKDLTCGWLQSHSCASREALCAPHGVRVVQNGRPMLEDAFSQAVIEVPTPGSSLDSGPVSFGPQEPLSFFGVFDGHGGAEVAQHAASKLHQHFLAAYKQLASAADLVSSRSACSDHSSTLEEVMCESWHSNSSAVTESSSCTSTVSTALDAVLAAGPLAGPADLSCSSPSSASSSSNGGSPTSQQVWASISAAAAVGVSQLGSSLKQQQQQPSKPSQCVIGALREAFLRTDADLAGTEVGEVVGTTAVTAVLSQSELFIGHCGDSRAVLCRRGVAVPLTSDHKPGREDEMARVSSLGGKVVYKAGSHRVMGLLAMSRALGDHFLRPYVIPEPEVLCLQRCPDDEILILATDGLWDVFSCQEATSLALRSTIRARQRGASASAACRVGASVLVRGAIERGSRDNITVAVIDLRRRQESIASVASVLASQCSSDLSGLLAGPSSRKRRSSSGNDDASDAEQADHLLPRAPLAHHSSICTGSTFTAAMRGAAAAGGSTSSSSRRLTCDSAGGSSGTSGGVNSSSNSRGSDVSWGWSLSGLHILPHHKPDGTPGNSIRALAQAAASAVAAFSGGVNRSVSGIPHQRGTTLPKQAGPPAPAAAAAAVGSGGGGAAGASGVTPPVTPTLSDLLSMQSAPALRHAGSAGKPPLPQSKAI